MLVKRKKKNRVISMFMTKDAHGYALQTTQVVIAGNTALLLSAAQHVKKSANRDKQL